MKKLVKENLNETGAMNDFDYIRGKSSNDIVREVKQYCKNVIGETDKYFKEIEETGIDADNELETYSSNAAMRNMAHQIMDIINTK